MVDTVELNVQTEAVSDAMEGYIAGNNLIFGTDGSGNKTTYPFEVIASDVREFADVDSDLLVDDNNKMLLLTHTSAQNLDVQLEATIAYEDGFSVLIVPLTDDATLTFQSGANINGQTSELVWAIEAVSTSNKGAFLKKRDAADNWILLGATVAP